MATPMPLRRTATVTLGETCRIIGFFTGPKPRGDTDDHALVSLMAGRFMP